MVNWKIKMIVLWQVVKFFEISLFITRLFIFFWHGKFFHAGAKKSNFTINLHLAEEKKITYLKFLCVLNKITH